MVSSSKPLSEQEGISLEDVYAELKGIRLQLEEIKDQLKNSDKRKSEKVEQEVDQDILDNMRRAGV